MKKLTYILSAFMILTACQKENGVNLLPEGKYPLIISSVQMMDDVQTRVSENTTNGMSSQWDGGEEITVQLSGTMDDGTSYTAEGKYTLNDDKQPLIPVIEKELYWHSTNNGIVTAWYSNVAASDNTITLGSQAGGLAYVLKAQPQNVTFNTSTTLTFSHQLAKIRVLITGTANIENATIKVKGHTQGTINCGTITRREDTKGWITMKRSSYSNGTICYEANVIPYTEYMLYKSAFQVITQYGETTTIDLDAGVNVSEKGKIHTITLTVNNRP